MDEDYVLSDQLHIFTPGDDRVCFQLRIVNDRRIEALESFNLVFTLLDITLVTFQGVQQAQIFIEDDDCKCINKLFK